MDLHRITRIASHVLGLAAAVLVAAGLSSYTFVATDGELIEVEKTRVRPVGAYISGRTVGSRRPATVEVIRPCYRYRVGEVAHESCRIGLGASHLTLAPFGRRPWETLQANDEVRVYYARQFPGIAVLTRGPDWVVSLGLALAALALAPAFPEIRGCGDSGRRRGRCIARGAHAKSAQAQAPASGRTGLTLRRGRSVG